MVNKVNIGFVGCGMIGQVAHIANFIKVSNCQVVAAAELRPELGRLAVEKFNIPKLYSSHIEMLKNCDLDAVVWPDTMRRSIGYVSLGLHLTLAVGWSA